MQARSTHWRATCSYPRLIRPTASISETTSVETSRTSKSLILLGEANARKWNTSASGDTQARIWRSLFGSFVIKACILRVYPLTVSLRRRALAQCQVKTTLGGIVIVDTTKSFDAQRIPSLLPSGGLELISSPFGDKLGCILVINALKEIIIIIN